MTSHVIVEADGGSRGNPGPAGYGAVVRDADGEVLAERKESLGVVTNNVAEYRGLIAGLTAAAELGASTVDVRMDSKLVVEQMSGRWKIKHLGWVPTFYVEIAGFERAVFQSGPASEAFPPDRPSAPQDNALGRSFLPFHYRHPFTGERVPAPTGRG